ncbi:MAG: GtrA family protein, partial [Candidatus Eremiobacteraeota bacterium]|nr:GtrA family protein [Candidatus Eremiobacteraeota bacterium]
MPNGIAAFAARRGVRQFVKFGIVGASGFLVNLVAFTLLQRVVPDHAKPLQYNVIYTVAFLAGGLSNYYLNRVWTFRSTGHAVHEGVKFMSVSVVALLVGLLVSAAVSPWLGHGHKTWFVAT